MKIVAENRKALHDFSIEDRLEVGIALTGSEIKSVRQGKVNLKDSYVQINKGELFLLGAHISTYEKTSSFVIDPIRTRKLLAHREEIDKLERKVKVKGYSLFPLKMYLNGGRAKLEIGLGKGKREYQKREMLKERDIKREIDKAIKSR